MIEFLPQSRGNVLGIRATGRLTDFDYSYVWIPKLKELIAAHGKIRLLVYLDENFQGWSVGALWQDAKFGIRHADGFEKIAIVGGSAWVERVLRGADWFLECEIETFPTDELRDAWAWLRRDVPQSMFSFVAGAMAGLVVGVTLAAWREADGKKAREAKATKDVIALDR